MGRNSARQLVAWLLACLAARAQAPFYVRVTDDQTGRGVPLVEFKTLSDLRFYTDSAGIAAFDEAGLDGHDVYVEVSSHGYQPFNRTLPVGRGRHEDLKIRRLNIAERLYRITGLGIYRDSLLVGLPAPIRNPLLSACVLGQDTASATLYRGHVFWIWGDTWDTARFVGRVTAATSALPAAGGLDPSIGIDLDYFTGKDGCADDMLPLPRRGLVWIEGLFTVKDPRGRDRLLATYTRVDKKKPAEERGLAVFDDAKRVFQPLIELPLYGHVSSHPFRHNEGGVAYWYLFPNERVRDDWRSVMNPATWESYSCLTSKGAPDRDSAGRLIWKWRPGARRIDYEEEADLLKKGVLRPGEGIFQLIDVETGHLCGARRGSVAWNNYRRRWIMIPQVFGEVYYAEADRPEGPWLRARKIVTHQDYTFYNTVHHPFFDQEGGKVIYFEGTYTDTFSAAKQKTPRYDYNQVMYRLSLDDPRLKAAQR